MESLKQPNEQQRDAPSLRADVALHDALIASNLPGKVYSDLNVRHQVDVFVWIPGEGRFAVEAKGSPHWIDDGKRCYLDSKHNINEARSTPIEDSSRNIRVSTPRRKRRTLQHPRPSLLMAPPARTISSTTQRQIGDRPPLLRRCHP